MTKPAFDVGKCTEYYFASKCIKRGINVLWPSLEALPYDIVLDLPSGFKKVQVKSTYVGKRYDRYKVKVHNINGKYSKDDIDFLVAYVYECDTFYIIPQTALPDTEQIYIYPHRSEVGQYEHFKNAFELLR